MKVLSRFASTIREEEDLNSRFGRLLSRDASFGGVDVDELGLTREFGLGIVDELGRLGMAFSDGTGTKPENEREREGLWERLC